MKCCGLALCWAALTIAAGVFPVVGRCEEPSAPARLRVVATIFPFYDWVRAIGGDRVNVHLLLPPGAEAHTYAPRPSDIVAARQADVFVYLHPAMEPWAHDILAGAIRPGLRIVELAENIKLLEPVEHHSGEGHEHEDEVDPHVWLDPLLAVEMVHTLANVLAETDPTHRADYVRNADNYCASLEQLDAQIREVLAPCRRRTVIFAGHNAFRYFAQRYGLRFVSPYAGFSPDAAPTPHALAALVNAVRQTGSTVIFHEELVSPRIAETIARETGAKLEMLHAAHNLTAEELQNGATYLSLMKANVQKLRKALDCP